MEREEILQKLKQYKQEKQAAYHFSRIGIFGSVSTDKSHGGSDIDIVIEQEVPDLFLLGTIKSDLEEAFGVKIDIIRLHNGLNKLLKQRISRDAIYV